MAKLHVKKGDEVVVIAGTARGQRGRILEVLLTKNRVIVEGLKMIKRHTRKNARNPEGAIVEREGTIHASNVVRAEAYDAKASKRTPAAAKA